MLKVFATGSGDLKARLSVIYESTRQISFYVAFKALNNTQLAETTLQQSMVQLARFSPYLEKTTKFDLDSLAVIFTRFNLSRTMRSHVPEAKLFSDDTLVNDYGLLDDPTMYALVTAIDTLAQRDRLILLLAHLHRFKNKQIADCLRMKPDSVIKRMNRARGHLRHAIAGRISDKTQATSAIEAGLRFWQNVNMTNLQAQAELNGHLFAPSFDEHTVTMMEEHVNPSPLKAILASKKLMYGVIGGAAAIVALLYLFSRRQPKETMREIQVSVGPSVSEIKSIGRSDNATSEKPAAESVRQTSGAASEKAPDEVNSPESIGLGYGGMLIRELEAQAKVRASATATRQIAKARRAVHKEAVVFVDPKTEVVYLINQGMTPKRLGDVQALVEKQGEVEHVGMDDTHVYFAFVSGHGAVMEQASGKVTEERYWQEQWFDDGAKLTPALKSGVVIEAINFQFAE